MVLNEGPERCHGTRDIEAYGDTRVSLIRLINQFQQSNFVIYVVNRLGTRCFSSDISSSWTE